MRLGFAVALLLGSASCGQGGGDNMMASSANALTPEQVDLALGPEVTNSEANTVDSSGDANASGAANVVAAADTEDAIDEGFADEPSASNNNSEQ